MPNLLLTDYCNRNCPYCFAKEKVTHTVKEDERNKFISMEDLEKVILYMKNSGLTLFSVLGGEPTLHPNFIEVFDRLWNENFKIRIFTNGLMSEEYLNYLASKVFEDKNRVIIILNVNHPEVTPRHEWQRLETALKALQGSVTLSFNIFKAESNWDFLTDLICTYHLNKNIRLGLAKPIVGAENQFLAVESYPEVGRKIVAFSEKCDTYDIKIGMDCGFVLCMFNESQLGKLYYNNVDFSILCGSIIDIGPDLTVWKCFPLSKMHNVHLTDFETESQLKDYYNEVYKPYQRFGMMDKCFRCKYLLRGQCSGGCIAYKIRAFKGTIRYGTDGPGDRYSRGECRLERN